jgi:hypothetical protein
MKRSFAGYSSISCELALGMETTLEATERELVEVRSILRGAVEGLMVEFRERSLQDGVVAVQFQEVADRLLANAQRRIEMVRAALGNESGVGSELAPPAAEPFP